MKLTQKDVKTLKLPPGKTDKIFFDDSVPGFGLRIRAGGSRTWIFQYMPRGGGTEQRMSLGSAKLISLDRARDGYREIDNHKVEFKIRGARDLYQLVLEGQDPKAMRRQAVLKTAQTFESLMKKYLERQVSEVRKSTYRDIARHLTKHAQCLHDLPIAKIAKADIATCLTSLKPDARFHNATGATLRNRVRTSLSGFFAWAVGEGILETNPVSGTNSAKEPTRDRVLNAAELQLIWKALDESNDYGVIMKLLMLTGQRAGEIAGLRRSEIQSEAILLPGERTKNHREHLIPLSRNAADIIAAQLKRQDSEREFVFGKGEGPFSGWSRSKDTLDKKIARLAGRPLPEWRPHDLRRAFATHAAEIGIQPHIIEAILNHFSGHRAGVAGIYNRATYDPEKRTALDRWANHLMAIVEARQSNVMQLSRPA